MYTLNQNYRERLLPPLEPDERELPREDDPPLRVPELPPLLRDGGEYDGRDEPDLLLLLPRAGAVDSREEPEPLRERVLSVERLPPVEEREVALSVDRVEVLSILRVRLLFVSCVREFRRS